MWKRTLTTARMASGLGVAALRRSLGVQPTPATDDLERVEKLVAELGALKGVLMKFGQIASYLPTGLSPAAQRVLATLQDRSEPMPYPRIAEAIQLELGACAEDAFESFERVPIAAASLGQVHRARYDGRDVAVKVQYPGIEALLRSDFKTLGLLARFMALGSAIDAGEVTGELRHRLLEECDYRREARQQMLFRELLETGGWGHVPAVIAERSTARVLTSELVPGQSFRDFIDSGDVAARDRAGAAIFAACFRGIFEHCLFNADPHPGNYLFSPAGEVWFLDFGCVRSLDPAMIDSWKRMALAVLDGDPIGFREPFAELGMVADAHRFDWNHQWQMMEYLYRPFRARRDEPFTFTPEYVSHSYDLILFDNPNRFRSRIPAEWVFLNRLQWGLNAVLAQLRATGPWPDLFRAAVESPTRPRAPSTDDTRSMA